MKKIISTECISWRWNGNLGDDMIYAAQEAMFAGSFELGQYVETPEAVIIGGGTFVPKAPENPQLLELSKSLPTVFFGTGVGETKFWGTDYIPIWLKIIDNSEFVGVRGPISKERLIKWGVDKNKVKWIGDAALFFHQEKKQRSNFKGKIAINFGTTYGNINGFLEEKIEETMIELIKHLNKLNWEVTLVSVWQPDDEVLERIQSKVEVKNIEYWHDDYAKALINIEKFDILICEKLHAGVVAACRNIPFIALNYRDKVMDFCQSINWDEFCVDTENLRVDKVLGLVNKLSQHPCEYENLLQQNVLNVKNRLMESVPLVVKSLVRQ